MGVIISVIGASEHLSGALFAVNLSSMLAAHSRKRTVYVDAGSDYAGAGELMPEGAAVRYLEELLPLAGKLDEKMLTGYFSPQEGSFAAVLSRANENHASAPLTASLDLLARCFDFVIVNPSSSDTASFSDVLALSGCAIVVTGNDIFSLSRARKIFRQVGRLHVSYSKLRTIVTELPQMDVPVPDDIIRSSLEGEPFAVLPINAAHINSSVNRRIPVAFLYPDSAFAHALKDIAARINDESASLPDIREPRKDYPDHAAASGQKDFIGIKKTLHSQLVEACRERSIDPLHSEGSGLAAREKARELLQEMMARDVTGLSQEDRKAIIAEVLDEAFGLGCLETLLKDPEITEIMVNGFEHIFVEKKGRILPVNTRFTSSTQLRTVIDRIVSPIGRRVDESSPIVDARLADGSRVNVIIPPVSLSGMVVTIRKFSERKLTVEDLIERGSLSRDMSAFLSICVRMRKNIVISGGTGSGKTTLLNVLSGFIPDDERIVTIEDAAELKLPQAHVVSLESRPPSVEGTGAIPIRRLVINALRMRPDRVVVGECRGGETLDMLQAMNTGHDGSLTTIHANTPRDSITRMITLAMMAGTELPERSIREQIAAAIHIIIQVSRMSDGSRKIVEISEVNGAVPQELGVIPLFRFEQTGILDTAVLGRYTPCGTPPSFLNEICAHGFSLESGIFQMRAES